MLKEAKTRREEVLALIVKRYVETAEPVGSGFVARHLGLSSATIRNVMSDLEEAGFISQPHTSAGRAPTDKGYRYYIDSLMHVRNVNDHMVKAVRQEYGEVLKSLEDVLEKTSHLMSSLTNYVGLALISWSDKVYLDGTSHIIEQPEFRDLKKLYAILKFLEAKSDILNLLSGEFEDENLTIHIGREDGPGYLKECSIVTRGYKIKGKVSGRLGVIGPKRMLYEKVIPTVDLLADTVSEIMEGLVI